MLLLGTFGGRFGRCTTTSSRILCDAAEGRAFMLLIAIIAVAVVNIVVATAIRRWRLTDHVDVVVDSSARMWYIHVCWHWLALLLLLLMRLIIFLVQGHASVVVVVVVIIIIIRIGSRAGN